MFGNINSVRNVHTTFAVFLRRRRGFNPGATQQLNILKDDNKLLADDPEGFGDLESDFMGMHKSHKQYLHELDAQRDRARQHTIKHKYFRNEKLPNLLTYAEKEQIKLLRARDPEEWSVERLAESFPASQDIIHKILKAKWKPRSETRIRKHDEAVIRNWELTNKNMLQLPIELREHLKKFTMRERKDIEISSNGWPIRTAITKPNGNEFLSLITSCKKYADDKTNDDNETKQKLLAVGRKSNTELSTPNPADETFLLDKVQDRRKMRIYELKAFKLTPVELKLSQQENSSNAKSLEQSAIHTFGNPNGTGVMPRVGHDHQQQLQQQRNISNGSNLATFNIADKFQSNEIVISHADQQRFDMSTVKSRIHIPRTLFRKGAIYRVEDCYYDDDGEFLYRVPGMTS